MRITAYQSYGVNGNTAQNIGVIPDLLVDSDHAGNIALLFSSMEPEGDNTGWAQLQLGGWMWFVELSQAAEEDTAPYFGEMLSAIPEGCGRKPYDQLPKDYDSEVCGKGSPYYKPRLAITPDFSETVIQDVRNRKDNYSTGKVDSPAESEYLGCKQI